MTQVPNIFIDELCEGDESKASKCREVTRLLAASKRGPVLVKNHTDTYHMLNHIIGSALEMTTYMNNLKKENSPIRNVSIFEFNDELAKV